MKDTLRDRIVGSHIIRLADPQAEMPTIDHYTNLPLFIEKATDYVKQCGRSMPDGVKRRFAQAVERANKLLAEVRT